MELFDFYKMVTSFRKINCADEFVGSVHIHVEELNQQLERKYVRRATRARWRWCSTHQIISANECERQLADPSTYWEVPDDITDYGQAETGGNALC